MKRKFTFLLMALLALTSFRSWGQNTITVDFESGIPFGWTTIDADGDGYCWFASSSYGANGGSYAAVSESFRGALTPDNYMVSPKLLIGTSASISFYEAAFWGWTEPICIMISTTGTNPSDFTQIQRWDVSNQDFAMKSVDLSDYAGQQVYIAFRHYDSTDNYKILIDDITITGATEVQLQKYNITYDSTIQHGTISGPATAYAGQTVTLTATPDANYALGQFFVNGSPIEGNTFIMPESDVTVSARFMHNFFTVDFERGIPFGWTTIDADGDGYNWITGINVGHNSSNYVCSQSYDDYVGELTPDNYLVSPLVQLGGFISFWACAQDANYPNEHFGVAVSTGSNTDAADFTTISEWTMTAKGGNRQSGERGTRSQGTWCQYTVDLSEYSGRGYVAIRHFNCTDQYILNVDDINMCFTDETDSYSISYPEQEHVSVGGISEAFAGQTVYLSTTVDEGYVLDELIVKNANTQETITVCDNQFVMPFDNVMISVSFHERQHYAVNIADGITGGTVTADPCIDVLEGTTVTLSATPATGYEFGAWIVTNVTTSEPIAVVNNQFIMPESNVTVTATFIPVLTLTVNDGTSVNTNNNSGQVPFNGYRADNYNNKSQFIIPASDLESMVEGTITDITFYLNSSSSNKEYTYDNFDIYVKEVDYTAVGYIYPEEFANMTKVYSGKLTTSNYQLTIHFSEPYVYNGQNLMIGFNQTAHGTWGFTYWLGKEDGTEMRSRSGYGSSVANSYNFLPKTTFTYTNPNLHGITLNQPEGGEIAASAGAALPGTIITLTATPELGYEFGEWIVSPSSVTITGNTFEMPASDVTVTATFNEVTQYGIAFVGIDEALITVAATFGGETITEAPAGTEVTLEYSDLNIGYTFGNWTLNGEALAGNTFTMPAEAVEVGVVLNERPRFAVTIDEAITNGTITAEPSSEILGGTLVTLTITPETGYTLDVLTVTDAESNPVAVTNNTFTMPESNVTVTATFVHGITVYDGTNTNNQVPVYGLYADSDYKSQFIFPAEDLEAMAGGIINSMTFYASEESVAIPGTWSVYVSEVENTTLSGLEDWANLDAVLEGATITISGHQMTVNFATPFLYNGGNLLIGFNETISGSYKSTNWYGVDQLANTAYFSYSGSYGSSNGPIQFLPKTTFLYTPVTPYTVNLHVNGVVSEEEVSSLPTPENIPAGMTFCGWTNSDIATYTTEAPSYVTKATADGEDFYAVFSYTEEEQTRGQNWVKITSPSELVDGEEIVLVYNNNYVVGGRSEYETNYVKYEAEISDGKIANLPTGATIFTLSGTSGSWKLNYYDIGLSISTTLSYMEYDSDGYLSYYGMWQSWGGTSYDEWSAEGTSRVIFKNNHSYEYIGEDETVYAELIHSVANANLACEAYKKDVATTTYYMTEVLTGGEVADLATKNIIVINPITVSGRLEMNAEGLFRNEFASNFVFKDGAQLIYDGAETVNATFEKNITGTEWHTISSPLAENTAFANVTNLIPSSGVTGTDYDLYRLNEAEGKWENARVNEGVAFTTIDKGLGYLYANATEIDHIAFAGEINVASVECTLTNDAAHGFNLIGNPFTQNIKMTDVEAGTAVLAGGFYVLTNQDTWGTEPSFGTIAPLQGFLVQATTAGTATISKPTAAPSKGERSEQNTNIEMIVSNSTYRDNAFAMFGEGIGLNKVNHRNAEAPMLYVPQDGEKFAIAFMDENTTVFPLNFKTMTTGNYSISLKPTDDINTLVLVDNMTGVETNMLLEGSYSFIGSPADNDSRFTVKLNISHNNGQADSEHFVYQNGSELVVNGEGTLQIFDVLGRVVISEEVHGQTVNVGGLSTGAYIVRMTGNEVKTQKIIIR